MPRRGIFALAITTVALVLLLSFKTPDATLPTRGGSVAIVGSAAQGSAAPAATPAPAASSGRAATQAPSTGSGTTSAATATVDGPVVNTRFGPVQVEVVIADGQLTDVVALQLPSGRRSGQISSYAEPVLREEALQAQSASIDIVSGATYTSDAYGQSLQAALDQAGIG